jgi:hypothetical protein
MAASRSLWVLLLASGLGCVPSPYKRVSIPGQLAAREIEVVAAQGAPDVAWLPVPPGSSEREWRLVQSPPGLTEPVARARANEALAAALIAAGNREKHVRFVGSALAGAPSLASGLSLASPPPAARPIVGVGVKSVSFFGSDEGDRAMLLMAELVAEHAKVVGEFGSPPRVSTNVADPVPRTRAEWTADGGKAITEALGQLIERGAPALVAELTAMTGPTIAQKGRHCGLEPTWQLAEAPLGPGLATLRWLPWASSEEGLPPLRTAYDVRVWRLGEAGYDPVVVKDGLSEPAVELELEPGYEYAMTARASLELEGGRRWRTPWSVPAPNGPRLCLGEPEPHVLLRRFAGPAAQVPVLRSLPPAPEANPGAERPVVETHAGLARVVPSSDRIKLGFTRGTTQTGQAAAAGAAEGIVRGVGESVRCLIFMPLCAIVFVPVGAIVGGVAGGVAEASLATTPGPQSDLLRGLAAVASDPAIQGAVLVAAGPPIGAPPGNEPPGAGGAEPARLEIGLVRASLAGGKTEEPATTLEVEVAATLHRPGAEPERRAVIAIGPGPVPMFLWLRDDHALLRGAIRTQAARAARELVRSFKGPATTPAPAPAATERKSTTWEPESFQ